MEEELTHLEQEGIIELVQFADWAAPIVSVMKDDGKSVRICSDFKLTINQASKLDHYLILRIEDLFAKLTGGKSFSKLDMSQAYQQVILEEDSRPYAVINTHTGFGISSAPGKSGMWGKVLLSHFYTWYTSGRASVHKCLQRVSVRVRLKG